jgi:hypothetical protein
VVRDLGGLRIGVDVDRQVPSSTSRPTLATSAYSCPAGMISPPPTWIDEVA